MDKDSQYIGPICLPRLRRAIGAAAVVLLVVAASDPGIAAAKTVMVHEAVHLHFVHNRGEVVDEKGGGFGTFDCPIVAQLKFTSTTQTHFSFTLLCTSKDTITGHGLVSYYASGATAHVTGSVAVTHGTGRYAHVSASELLITGTFQRKTFAVTLSISGHMST